MKVGFHSKIYRLKTVVLLIPSSTTYDSNMFIHKNTNKERLDYTTLHLQILQDRVESRLNKLYTYRRNFEKI